MRYHCGVDASRLSSVLSERAAEFSAREREECAVDDIETGEGYIRFRIYHGNEPSESLYFQAKVISEEDGTCILDGGIFRDEKKNGKHGFGAILSSFLPRLFAFLTVGVLSYLIVLGISFIFGSRNFLYPLIAPVLFLSAGLYRFMHSRFGTRRRLHRFLTGELACRELP